MADVTPQFPPKPSMRFFAAFAIVMVVFSYLFALLLAAACVLLPYLVIANSESPNGQVVIVFLFGIAIAGAILWSLIPRRDKFTPPGLLLTRASQPGLFAEIEYIAGALNEPVPAEVYLIGEANAFVADRGGILGFGSRRILGIGLPLLSIMTVSQFRAVLAHEFAHYYGGDTRLGPWVYKTKKSIVRIFENIGSIGSLARTAVVGIMYLVVTFLLKWYFIAFLRAINFVSRRQEYRADELACIVAGRENLIDGLRAVHTAAVAWPAYWKTEVAPSIGSGSLLALSQGLSRFTVTPRIASALADSLQKQLQEEKSAPYDTHPPLRDRIAAAQKLPPASAPQNPEVAITLIQDLANTELALVRHGVEDAPATLEYVAWEDAAAKVTIPAWQRFVNDYPEPLKGLRAHDLADQVPNFPRIGSGIRDPKGMLLSPEQRTQRAGFLFASALSLALLRTGWKLEVGPAVFHLRFGQEELNPFDVTSRLLQKTMSREAWLEQCERLGIAELPLSPSEPITATLQTELFASDQKVQPA